MKDAEIDRINAERRRRSLPPLSKWDARVALSSQPAQSDDSALHFLIGYTTGIPMPSGAGIVGAMLHSSSSSPDAPGYSAPDPSPSYSSSDSSSSYDSGSSSSSDSGSSSGGSDF